jgi:hypothetical protein
VGARRTSKFCDALRNHYLASSLNTFHLRISDTNYSPTGAKKCTFGKVFTLFLIFFAVYELIIDVLQAERYLHDIHYYKQVAGTVTNSSYWVGPWTSSNCTRFPEDGYCVNGCYTNFAHVLDRLVDGDIYFSGFGPSITFGVRREGDDYDDESSSIVAPTTVEAEIFWQWFLAFSVIGPAVSILHYFVQVFCLAEPDIEDLDLRDSRTRQCAALGCFEFLVIVIDRAPRTLMLVVFLITLYNGPVSLNCLECAAKQKAFLAAPANTTACSVSNIQQLNDIFTLGSNYSLFAQCFITALAGTCFAFAKWFWEYFARGWVRTALSCCLTIVVAVLMTMAIHLVTCILFRPCSPPPKVLKVEA